jgi:chorismate dehydratase
LAEGDPALDLATIFRDSRDHGLKPDGISQIARQWGPRLRMAETGVRAYLTENIHYELDPGCIEGLQLFYRYAAEIGALPGAPALRFLQAGGPHETDQVSAAQ